MKTFQNYFQRQFEKKTEKNGRRNTVLHIMIPQLLCSKINWKVILLCVIIDHVDDLSWHVNDLLINVFVWY